ncbi:MAG: type II secretion system protein [Xanthomonadales bacterium]|nr:type II secretion system GspH family protein [Gammaproteobacteria bacterium]MBT8055957.1 type II secretion system GspH family protein [Gammaproteobacteria bacterium]NNL04778.1 type II secretion system protein [Xanthomonadales bacterium]
MKTRADHLTSAPRRDGGFTLLELLLAFMVFALSFAVVLEILSGSMRNTVRARHFTEAALLAQSVMDQVGVVIPLESGLQLSGEDEEYRWTLEMYVYEGGEQNTDPVLLAELIGIGLMQVDLYVSWGEPPVEQVRRFTTVKALLAGRMNEAP